MIHPPAVFPAQAETCPTRSTRSPLSRERRIVLQVFALLLLTALPVQAEEFVYQPEPCEFSITYPEHPYDTQRCAKDNVNQCVDIKSFTQVFEAGGTVNFRTHCEESRLAAYQSYTEQTTQTVLKAMARRNHVTVLNNTYREDEEERYKIAGILAEGQSGTKGMIYLAQMWIGKNSVMTVEAELIGQEQVGADTLFRDVLRSVGYVAEGDGDGEENESSEK